MWKYTIIYLFVMMSVIPMQRINDPIADIQFKETKRVTFDYHCVKNANFLYSVRAVKQKSNEVMINQALNGWTLYDMKVEKKYYNLDSLLIEILEKGGN